MGDVHGFCGGGRRVEAWKEGMETRNVRNEEESGGGGGGGVGLNNKMEPRREASRRSIKGGAGENSIDETETNRKKLKKLFDFLGIPEKFGFLIFV